MISHFRDRFLILLAMGLVFLIGGCVTLDRNTPRTPSIALAEAEAKETSLGRQWLARAPADPTHSAFRLLPNSLEAFAARVALIDAAERTLDVQYYIFSSDETGLYIIDRLVAAADRGVRVRILVDDMYAHGIEKGLVAFDAHPNIELRLFNPWTQRSGSLTRGVEFLLRPRLNHRMHNKTMVADSTLAILGGRNLADEYFDLHSDFDFKDLDVGVAGPAAMEANHLFDSFWNGPDAIPVTGIKPRPDGATMLEAGRTRLEKHRERMKGTAYADAVRDTALVRKLSSKSVDWVVARGRVLGDAPEKTTRWNDANWTDSLVKQVRDVFLSAKRELVIASPYFVPGKKGASRMCELAAKGASVRVLTNSQAANDVQIVHAGYAKYRRQLVKGNVELFELRRRGAPVDSNDEDRRAFGSANASLHAKTFVVDRAQVFIGSLNLDPRSVLQNTEVGVLIDSPELAESVAGMITSLMSRQWSYQVALTPSGKLQWIGEDSRKEEVRFSSDPDTSWWDRFKTGFLGLLPVESQI